MMSTRADGRLGVGILGCGPIAQMGHIKAVISAENAYLAAVCDQAPDLAIRLGDYYGAASSYNHIEDLLADPAVELVIVAVGDQMHVPLSMQSLSAGKHVLVEKPIGKSTEAVEKLCTQVLKSKSKLQVGHMKRFDPALRYAKNFARNEIGDLISIKAWYCDSTLRYDLTNSVLPHIIRSKNSVPKPEPSNKPHYFLRAHGSHLIDMVQYMAGPINHLYAQFREQAEIRNWVVQGALESGANVQLDLTVAIREDW